jgi:hypothetical protein
MASECRVCKLLKEKPKYLLYEDSEYIAILDPNPHIDGQTILVDKQHGPGFAFLNDQEYTSLFAESCMRIMKEISPAFSAKTMHVIMGNDKDGHPFATFYPDYGMKNKKFAEIMNSRNPRFRNYFDYVEYLSTFEGPKATEEELSSIYKVITKRLKPNPDSNYAG